jgi:hypothetical protein
MAGNLTRTLVVGGMADFLEKTLRRRLAAYGLAVDWHQESSATMPVNIPANVEVVVVFQDMVRNKYVTRGYREEAKKRDIPCIILERHAASWPETLQRHGFAQIPPVAAAAVAEHQEPEPMAQQKTPTQPPSEYHERLAFLKEALRELAEKDGVQSLAWDAKSGLVRVQRKVWVEQEDIL